MCELSKIIHPDTLEVLKYLQRITSTEDRAQRINISLFEYNININSYMMEGTGTHYIGTSNEIFMMSVKYQSENTEDENKYRKGLSIRNHNMGMVSFVNKSSLRYIEDFIEFNDDLDYTDLFSLSTMFELDAVQELYVLHQLRKNTEIYGLAFNVGYVKVLSNIIKFFGKRPVYELS